MRLSIRAILYAGFGLLIGVAGAITAAAVIGLGEVSKAQVEVKEMGSDLVVGARSRHALKLMRIELQDFLLTNAQEDAEAFELQAERFAATLDESDASFQHPERRALLAEVRAEFEAYSDAFSRVRDVTFERNERVERAHAAGKAARERLTAAIRAATGEANAAALAVSAEAMQNLMLARLYALDYVRTGNDDDAVTFATWADRALGSLADAERAGAAEEHLMTARSLVEEFSRETGALGLLVKRRGSIVTDELDVIGVRILGLSEQIEATLVRDKELVTAAAIAEKAESQRVVIGVAIIGAVLGTAIAVFASRFVVRALKRFGDQVGPIAEGDLTIRCDASIGGELSVLAQRINEVVESLAMVIGSAKSVSLQVAGSAQAVVSASTGIADSLVSQETHAQQISAAVEEMRQAVVDIARSAAEASEASSANERAAAEGAEVVRTTAGEMDAIADEVRGAALIVVGLGDRSDEIGNIIAVINDIAEQTNLLALNAAIEAARAGEHGRGFAVVADEVRKLAERTTTATEQVSNSIHQIQRETRAAVERIESGSERASRGVAMANEAGTSIASIVGASQTLRGMITNIAASTEQQSATSEQIVRVITEMGEMTRASAAAARDSGQGASMLTHQAEALQNSVERFKLAG